MRNVNLKKLSLIIVLFFVASALMTYAQPSITQVATQTTTWGASLKIILNWLLSLAAAGGGVVVGFKLFSGKPDAREGIMMWVGGILFCGAVLLAINLLG